MKVVAISGSLRKDSLNTALISVSQSLAPEGLDIVRLDISELPIYNMDLEIQLPGSVIALHEAVNAADGILFTCPEHNFSYSGVLKNAIDWGSRPSGQSAWNRKPVIIQSAAAGWAGGLRAQYHLHQVLGYFEMKLLRYPEVCIGLAHKKFDESLKLTDEMAIGDIKKQLAAFAELIQSTI